MKDIEDFLIKNGFEKVRNRYFKNDKCRIYVNLDHYIIDAKYAGIEGTMYSSTLEIYWLIGVLTYYDLIDKNYIK